MNEVDKMVMRDTEREETTWEVIKSLLYRFIFGVILSFIFLGIVKLFQLL